MRELPRIIVWGSHLCCCVVCGSVVGLALVGEGVLTCVAAARPWQWGPGCPNQHWPNTCVRSEDFKKYIIPGELIVRISLATLAFHPHFAMVSRRSSQVRGPSVISSSWSPKTGCLSLFSQWGGGRSTAGSAREQRRREWDFVKGGGLTTSEGGLNS